MVSGWVSDLIGKLFTVAIKHLLLFIVSAGKIQKQDKTLWNNAIHLTKAVERKEWRLLK